MSRFALIVSMTLLNSACATLSSNPDVQSVTFARRFAFDICSGSCPSYDLKVTPDGWVDVRQRNGFKEHYRFKVAAYAARAAINEVAAIPSDLTESFISACALPPDMPAEIFDPNVRQFAIELNRLSGTKQIIACADNSTVVSAFKKAITAMGVGPTGRPFVKQKIDGSRFGQRVLCDLGDRRWSMLRFD